MIRGSQSSPVQEGNQNDTALLKIGGVSGPATAFPQGLSVLDLFHAVAERDPDRIALRYRDASLTYQALDRKANALAARLIERGVGRGTLVPVFVTDGLAFPIALVSVLKAGAAFVPLDPSWPGSRLRRILEELDPAVALVTSDGARVLAAFDMRVPTVTVDTDEAGLRERPELARLPGSSDLIYGYYTSGSTGRPKCALNHHRGLVNRLAAMSRWFGDGATHVALLNSRSTFDSAMWQVWWPLTTGGQVVLPHRDGILDLARTVHTISRYGVTITDFVPSVLAALVGLLEAKPQLRESLGCLRRLLIGGEAASPAVVRRFTALLPQVAVTNTYGPTECSIGSVFHDIGAADADVIPLGRPIDNTAVIVLDEEGWPVPRGEVGEIHLAGECLGAGYLADEERTRSTFIANPYPGVPGKQLYRTGDLGWLDERDLLHFVGRRDHQVKIGGVRVELGDVAAAFAGHADVGAVEVAVLGPDHHRTMVACVTPRTSATRLDVAELRRHAGERLPAELVPHRVVVLESLPVNENGKADRAALVRILEAQNGGVDVTSGGPGQPPQTREETLVAAAWAEVLGLTGVPVDRSFQECGGTSLAAFQVATLLGSRLAREVRPADVVVTQTVREQAALLVTGVAVRTADRDRADRALMAGDAARDGLPANIPAGPARARRLLVTGGTGFIGAHLVADLLARDEVEIWCLVRAGSGESPARRLAAGFEDYGLQTAAAALPAALSRGQVQIVQGDLGEVRFGLSDQRFAEIARRVDGVLHAGAMVNLVASYVDHRPANVAAVRELVRLAAQGDGCRIHLLSTLGAFPALSDDGGELVAEELAPAAAALPPDGYSRSKQAAENLLAAARHNGLTSAVYRLGEVWPHRSTGTANGTSLAHMVLYACALTGCVFTTEATVDLTPVDAVSDIITRCAVADLAPADGVYHLVWPRPLRFAEAFDALAQRYGCQSVSYAEFRGRVRALVGAVPPDPRLARLDALLPSPGPRAAAPECFDELFSEGSSGYDTTRFRQLAEPVGAPPLDTIGSYLGALGEVRRIGQS